MSSAHRHNARVSYTGGRREQVLGLIRQSHVPLDDDQIARAAQMNRVYVNAICLRLAEENLIIRGRGGAGKIVNSAVNGESAPLENVLSGSFDMPTRRRRSLQQATEELADRIKELTTGFAGYVAAFEARQAFPGPSLYFHLRAVERRREHQTVSSLLDDRLFLEYVYAVLPAWGMHRLGPQAAKVGDFTEITTALRQTAPVLQQLWPLRITTLSEQDSRQVAADAWEVISRIKVSTSRTQIVAGSKFLHHVLPDLVPPIDRRYTFTFFTRQQQVPNDRAAFLDWFPRLAEVGGRCREPILNAVARGGFMATGEAKVIDNAIMGFMQTGYSNLPRRARWAR